MTFMDFLKSCTKCNIAQRVVLKLLKKWCWLCRQQVLTWPKTARTVWTTAHGNPCVKCFLTQMYPSSLSLCKCMKVPRMRIAWDRR